MARSVIVGSFNGSLITGVDMAQPGNDTTVIISQWVHFNADHDPDKCCHLCGKLFQLCECEPNLAWEQQFDAKA